MKKEYCVSILQKGKIKMRELISYTQYVVLQASSGLWSNTYRLFEDSTFISGDGRSISVFFEIILVGSSWFFLDQGPPFI